MLPEVISGILLPFWGTLIGSACVLFVNKELSAVKRAAINTFAAGVMVAAAVFSLLIPAVGQAKASGSALAFASVHFGFIAGMMLLLLTDILLTRYGKNTSSGSMSYLAITIHNLPEGMAVGVVFAAFVAAPSALSYASALAVSIGIALQNFPEGAITSLTLRSDGMRRVQALILGALSGIIEPAGAVFTLICIGFVLPILPFLLSFAAGTMIYVVIEELIPDFSGTEQSRLGNLSFALGFTLMMVLDVALG
jgi:ZIP family zinc transporter